MQHSGPTDPGLNPPSTAAPFLLSWHSAPQTLLSSAVAPRQPENNVHSEVFQRRPQFIHKCLEVAIMWTRPPDIQAPCGRPKTSQFEPALGPVSDWCPRPPPLHYTDPLQPQQIIQFRFLLLSLFVLKLCLWCDKTQKELQSQWTVGRTAAKPASQAATLKSHQLKQSKTALKNKLKKTNYDV